jgi:hypothetical protein
MASPAQSPQKTSSTGALAPTGKHSGRVLDQLLHALNQPVAGLQCSLEVALSAPRTGEQYARILREGLELTERVRALVGAIGEVVYGQEESDDSSDRFALVPLLEKVIEELLPVAEARGVQLAADFSAASASELSVDRSRFAAALLRLIESILSLAKARTTVQLTVAGHPDEVCLQIQWTGENAGGPLSLAELGLLVAQAACERSGAQWERKPMAGLETITIRFPAEPVIKDP